MRYPNRAKTILTALFLIAALICPIAHAADQDKDKDKKPEREKKEKIEPWVEIRTLHFLVASDGGEKTARRFADEFETLLRVFQATMPKSRVTNGIPIRILVARDGQSFARMAPEFPYDKRHDQPPNMFASGSEKTYIGIRANASGRFMRAELFKSVARDVLKRSYRKLPPWLEEGFSTVYGSVTFNDHGVRLDRPDPEDLSVLFESPLLPLDLVLHVDRASPYYSPGDKGSVYFAESRVLVHFLISDPQFAGTKAMERYVTAVEGGADSLQAARDTFGDLNQLQAKLETFVNLSKGAPADIPINGTNESGGPARTLSPPEIEARMADFLSLRGRADDAQGDLEEAISSEPSLAEAEQSLGFLLLKKNNLDDAEKHFERAVQLDPKDALNFYGRGLVVLAKAENPDTSNGAEVAFEKAASLNPDFAPAWYNLAMIYSQRDDTLPKALADSQRAASLEPGNTGYQLQVTELQDRVAHPGEARVAVARTQGPAASRATTDKLADLAAKISPRQAPPPPPPGGSSPAKPPSAAGPPVPPAPSTPTTSKSDSATTPAAPVFSETKVYSMVGTIAEVNCTAAPQVQLSLKSLTILMKLHAADFAKVSIKSAGSESTSEKSASCASLRGRSARISYTLVLDKPWDGEMQEVEFRNQP